MQRIQLAEMKALELDILREIDSFCRDRGLTYYLTAGTLLGAVRHKGFIPWDDDIDLTMPRADYEELFRTFNASHEDSNFRLVSYRDRSSIYPFFKIVDSRTLVVEKYVDPRFSSGVWVDIFPLEGLPDTDEVFRKAERVKRMYDVIVANPDVATSPTRKLIKKVVTPIARRRDIFAVAAKLDRRASALPIRPGRDVGYIIWSFGPCERMPYSFLESTELEFEGSTFTAPRDYDAYLTSIYGDYMTPPPERDRLPHYCEAYWRDGVMHG